MNRLLTFRLLLVAFVALYVATIFSFSTTPSMPAEVVSYQNWLESQSNDISPIRGILCGLGHLADIAGLILLFSRRRIGVWFLVVGFVSCFGVGSTEIPYLQTALTGNLMALTNIFWGAIVALSLSAPDGFFVSKSNG